MRDGELEHQYFFVDESGDPTFYDKRGRSLIGTDGCSKIFMLGLIRTKDPKSLRAAIGRLHREIRDDRYLQSIPSFSKTLRAFHAKDDSPEIRERVYKLIVDLNFKAEFVVARKEEEIFQRRHKGKETIFYDDLITKLFENKLHRAKENKIYFAVRGNSTRQEPLENAIQMAANNFEKKWSATVTSETLIFPQQPSDEPCLQIIDYMNWAVQRVFTKGDDRYYNFVKEKVSFLLDLYDFDKYPRNFYSRSNPFQLNKISPL